MNTDDLLKRYPHAAEAILKFLEAQGTQNFDTVCYYVFYDMERTLEVHRLIKQMVGAGWLTVESGRYTLTDQGHKVMAS